MTQSSVLEVADVWIRYRSNANGEPAVKGASLRVCAGESLGIIGESGSGKSTLAYSLVGWAPEAEVQGSIKVGGIEVVGAGSADLRRVRSKLVGFVPQDPMKSLDPSMRIGRQIIEQMLALGDKDRRAVNERALGLLEEVGLPDVASIMSRFPHELSGGQQQRVLIAMALSTKPDLIVLDEPTTGLDATTATRIISLVKNLIVSNNCALVVISHDLSVVARLCGTVTVMQQGKIVEAGEVNEVLRHPEAAYTQRLLAALPRDEVRDIGAPKNRESTVLEAQGLSKEYRSPRAVKRHSGTPALLDASFSVRRGETLSIVGESGSGKSTLAQTLCGLLRPTSGSVALHGRIMAAQARKRSQEQNMRLQMVFQNPDASLNPRHSIATILKRPLELYGVCRGSEAKDRVAELLDMVRLPADFAQRRPWQLSGGEKQRIAIARAFAGNPDVIVCDEPTSALDVSVQDSILKLLLALQEERRVSYVFITHDLNVVRRLGGEMIVMRSGACVETGRVVDLFERPTDPYTKELLRAAPTVEAALGTG